MDVVKLSDLMERTSGSPQVRIGLIDGPVLTTHPDLTVEHLREIPGHHSTMCAQATSVACLHGTFIAGVLSAKRDSPAPGICPSCTLLLRVVFSETPPGRDGMPTTTPQELATALIQCIDAGAHVVNLSLGLAQPSVRGERALEEALDHAVRRGVIVVAAAGNQGALGSSVITRHPWVIPVVACDRHGRPMKESNLGNSIGRRGLRAPGEAITSLGAGGQPLTLGGSSIAVPFVTGTIALLRAAFRNASAAHVRLAITQSAAPQRASVVPPLLDAAAAYQSLLTTGTRS